MTFNLVANAFIVGRQSLSIFYTPHTVSRAAVAEILVLPDPVPLFSHGALPGEGLSAENNVAIQLRAQHFRTALSADSLQSKLLVR